MTTKLQFASFADPGDLEKERVIYRATSDVDVGSYAILRSKRSSEGGPISGSKIAYWFPDVEVKADDLVVVYTKRGTRKTRSLQRGNTAHFFYWGRDEAMWGKNSDFVAVLLLVAEWSSADPTD